MKTTVQVLIVAIVVAGPGSAWAQQPASTPRDLAGVSLEELLNIRVTSAARKAQRAEDVPAAVYVITQDDIRRSGLRTLPEIFRLVPGMQVAQINPNKWAVSIRGFNDLYANKVLVLVDGRSIYNRVFSGVLWNLQDLVLDDIERIEVIRGPGGAVWGANAMNGIINVITRSAAATKGTAVDLSVGTTERDRIAVRHGGGIGNMAYRVYSQYSGYDDFPKAGGHGTDRWYSLTGGLRMDWTRGSNELMAQVTATDAVSRPHWLELSEQTGVAGVTTETSDTDEWAAVGRWTRTGRAGSVLTVQGFAQTAYLEDPLFWSRERTSDVDAHYQRSFGQRHDVVFGGGVRHAALDTRGTFTLEIAPDSNSVFNTFGQDEIALGKGVSATLGAKLEHDTHAGWGLLPSARVMWEASPNQHVWAGVSRARRTPSASDRLLRVYLGSLPGEQLPVYYGFAGNPDLASERLVQVEGGYRIRRGSSANLEVTAFHGRYTDLRTNEPTVPVVEMRPTPQVFVGARADNLLDVNTTGLEISGRWAPTSVWRVDGSYAALRFTPHVRPASLDAAAAVDDGNAPSSQWQLHSSAWLTARTEIDFSFYRVGRLRSLQIPAYSRADARLEFTLGPQLSLAVVGQNLTSRHHLEFSGVDSLMQASAVPRSGRLQLRWQF
jgi:iron complex outermembrane recepter protein